jgi:8-oxo-dGTP diphosphatase
VTADASPPAGSHHDTRPTGTPRDETGPTIAVVTVVAAVIEEHDRFLVSQRQAGVHLAGLWEFPGGKLDSGETHAQALRREMREELDTDVDVGELVFDVAHAYPERTVALFFYRCRLRGTPRPLLGQEVRWVPRAELATLGFPPADEELIARLTGN